ncbi:hypothetical protein COD67_04720 [Bacillus cereus]|nr:hypothetical protein COI89_20175 [Bacillus cereus]PGU69402.1 hypothetical protein COD67_04720 [Bacillus cereus]
MFDYAGQQVRTIIKEGEPWFVAKDIAEILEIKNIRQVLGKLDEDEKGVYSVYTLGGNQKTTIINESGLYSIVLTSRKPKAKAFKRWVAREVIPSIRKHSAYMTENTLELKDAKPKVAKYEEFLDADGLATFTLVGKHFLGGMTAIQVRQFLQGAGVLFNRKIDGVYAPRKDSKNISALSHTHVLTTIVLK